MDFFVIAHILFSLQLAKQQPFLPLTGTGTPCQRLALTSMWNNKYYTMKPSSWHNGASQPAAPAEKVENTSQGRFWAEAFAGALDKSQRHFAWRGVWGVAHLSQERPPGSRQRPFPTTDNNWLRRVKSTGNWNLPKLTQADASVVSAEKNQQALWWFGRSQVGLIPRGCVLHRMRLPGWFKPMVFDWWERIFYCRVWGRTSSLQARLSPPQSSPFGSQGHFGQAR